MDYCLSWLHEILMPSLYGGGIIPIETLYAKSHLPGLVQPGDTFMLDIAFLALGLGIFAGLTAYAYSCNRL